jgi:predicted transcriptional regulator
VTLQEVVDALSLKVIAGAHTLGRPVTGGYACDLLSCVMAGAQSGSIWVTMQGHPNVVAVASLLGLAAVVVSEDSAIDPGTVQRAEENSLALLSTPHDTFTTVAKLAALGIQGAR